MYSFRVWSLRLWENTYRKGRNVQEKIFNSFPLAQSTSLFLSKNTHNVGVTTWFASPRKKYHRLNIFILSKHVKKTYNWTLLTWWMEHTVNSVWKSCTIRNWINQSLQIQQIRFIMIWRCRKTHWYGLYRYSIHSKKNPHEE